MKVLISQILRRLASAIEVDTTPSDDRKVKPKVIHVDDPIKTTARPHIKPPRREPSYMNDEVETRNDMKSYMQEYRAEGKDLDNGNRYIKKNK